MASLNTQERSTPAADETAADRSTNSANQTQEFRRSFKKPQESPKFDFKPGQNGGHDNGKSGERTLTRSSRNDNIPADGKPTHRETRTHDTTIHTTVKPSVVHETIRPMETEIIDTELTVHRHVHHYVHRIQPVIVSSFEEERLAHDILGQGQPALGNAMYRDIMDIKGVSQGENSNEMCKLCGAEGKLLSHIGSLKRHNNELSTTGACPVCGSDRGFGKSGEADVRKDAGTMGGSERGRNMREKDVNEGLGDRREDSGNTRERELAGEPVVRGEGSTGGFGASRGVETCRRGFTIPQAAHTRGFNASQGTAGAGDSTEGFSGSHSVESSRSGFGASGAQHTRGFNASQAAAVGSDGELTRGIRDMNISE